MNEAIIAELLGAVNSMRKDLTAHMQGEEGEITKMKDSIAQVQDDLTEWRIAAEKRHSSLIQSLESWTDKIDCSNAFLVKDGKLDLQGHKDDHLTRLQFDDWTKKVKQEVIMNTAKVGTLGVGTWLLYVIWEAFIKGPK